MEIAKFRQKIKKNLGVNPLESKKIKLKDLSPQNLNFLIVKKMKLKNFIKLKPPVVQGNDENLKFRFLQQIPLSKKLGVLNLINYVL